jgi:mRNA-degrading endonuclease RelE of RelBE toxin-antitoxin system
MKVTFSSKSKKQLKNLNPRIQQKILTTLTKFQNNVPVDIKKLKNKDNEFRIRVGNYRVQLKNVEKGFLITKIGKRENFYTIFFA